ncbi:hypothetical protein PPERSA_05158 [Pseudocohnilembus persalinus]|uniref:Uncharacterized protein n=1 Tax=Pseudocohnilembus persalinus TaxID=266149 RepID=A0A0V0R998_PSEPJ|nr:hypothetical protein PPERSA_05158 [Pseudocohnilembus persalinus]|eukprot:KRX11049.1 hypothetical protein PPERSA_05158 [Pseudocohnilembus persalinus]
MNSIPKLDLDFEINQSKLSSRKLVQDSSISNQITKRNEQEQTLNINQYQDNNSGYLSSINLKSKSKFKIYNFCELTNGGTPNRKIQEINSFPSANSFDNQKQILNKIDLFKPKSFQNTDVDQNQIKKKIKSRKSYQYPRYGNGKAFPSFNSHRLNKQNNTLNQGFALKNQEQWKKQKWEKFRQFSINTGFQLAFKKPYVYSA